MQPANPTPYHDIAGLVTPGILRELTADALAALAAGGTPPIEDRARLTPAVEALLQALSRYVFDNGGALHQESPVITVTCPWSSDVSVTSWYRRLRHALLLSCGLDIAPGTAQLDGWTVTVRGEQS